MSSAAGALAVAAVTIDHCRGCCRTFIADRATGTSTAERRRCWCLHRLPPVGVFRVTWHIFRAAGPRRFGSAEDACFREFLWSDIKGAGRYYDRFSAATHSRHRAAAMPAEPSCETARGGQIEPGDLRSALCPDELRRFDVDIGRVGCAGGFATTFAMAVRELGEGRVDGVRDLPAKTAASECFIH